MDKQNLIDKHVTGSLNADEKKQFEIWLKEDNTFKNDVSFYENLTAVSRESAKAELKEQLKKRESKIANKGKNNLRRILLVVLGLLLIASALIGYQLEKKKKSPEGIYASYYEPYPNVYYPVTRGNTDDMTQAFMAYENRDYKTAAEKLEERLKTSSAIELKFYQAISYAEMGNLPLAIGNLEDIKRFSSEYIDETYWYLGLFYLKQYNYQAAITHFQDFIELTKDTTKKADAIKILKRIM